MQYLSNHTVSNLVANKVRRQLVDAPVSTSIQTLLQLMHANKCQAIAVYGQSGHWLSAGQNNATFGEKQYIGIVSMLDVILNLTTQVYSKGDETIPIDHFHLDKLTKDSVLNIIGNTNESLSLWTTNLSSQLMNLVEPMGKGIHRVLVQDLSKQQNVNNQPWMMITQTDVIKYFLQHSTDMKKEPELFEFFTKSIENAKVYNYTSPLFTADLNSSLIQIFMEMSHLNISAVPVVDSTRNGILLETLSISDLREFVCEHVVKGDLYGLVTNMRNFTVKKFLELTKDSNLSQTDTIYNYKSSLLYCKKNESVGNACAKAINGKVHRVWVVEDHPTEFGGLIPVGSLSFTDVLRSLFIN